jgi:hypothetical protein
MERKQRQKEQIGFWSTGAMLVGMIALTIYALIQQIS